MKRYKSLLEDDKNKRFALLLSDMKHSRGSFKYFDTEKEAVDFVKKLHSQNKLMRYVEIELLDRSIKDYQSPKYSRVLWDGLHNELYVRGYLERI
jgi:hypothetical protein